jgi:hypothetical protein
MAYVLSQPSSGVTYKERGFALDTGFIPPLHCLQFLITIYFFQFTITV